MSAAEVPPSSNTPESSTLADASFLMQTVQFPVTVWRYLLSIWGWQGFYQRKNKNLPYVCSVHRVVWLADLIWTLTLAASIYFWFWNWNSVTLRLSRDGWGPYVLAVILWRLFDAFVNAVDVSPFGAGAVRAGTRTPELNQRLVLLNMMTLVEVIFWNASLTFHLSEWGVAEYDKPFRNPIIDMNPATPLADGMVHALQTSFSTITTIGYGTYAPSNLCAVLLAFLEAFSGLLLISMVAAAAISLTVAPVEKSAETSTGMPAATSDATFGAGGATAPSNISTSPLASLLGQNAQSCYLRWWLPLLATSVMLKGLGDWLAQIVR
jgi:hypothetical protein